MAHPQGDAGLADEITVLVWDDPENGVHYDLFGAVTDVEDRTMLAVVAASILATWLLGGFMLPILCLAGAMAVGYALMGLAFSAGAMAISSPGKLSAVLDRLDATHSGRDPALPKIILVAFDPDRGIPVWLSFSAVSVVGVVASRYAPAGGWTEYGIALATLAIHYVSELPGNGTSGEEAAFTRGTLRRWLEDRGLVTAEGHADRPASVTE